MLAGVPKVDRGQLGWDPHQGGPHQDSPQGRLAGKEEQKAQQNSEGVERSLMFF